MEGAKTLYEAGEKAMKAKQYDEAMAKYEEAYKLAPALHLFTYNIALAAERGGDCPKAVRYYRMFLDLVPEHDKRAEVQRGLPGLEKECPSDAESQATLSVEARDEQKLSRAEREANVMLAEAYVDIVGAIEFYEQLAKKFAKAGPFSRAARRKKWHKKRIIKVLQEFRVNPDSASKEELHIPEDAKQACAEASRRERLSAQKFEEVLDHYDASTVIRLMARFARVAARFEGKFDACG
jgi:tetratricopeptide (TPR) repeat protein